MSEDDGVEAEPTKVGGGALAVQEAIHAAMTTPNDKATSKMNAFDLEQALHRIARPDAEPEAGLRPTVPHPLPDALPDALPDVLPDAPPDATPPARLPEVESAPRMRTLTLLAAIFVAIACAILFRH